MTHRAYIARRRGLSEGSTMRTLCMLLGLAFVSFGCGDEVDPGGSTSDVPSWFTPSDAAPPPGSGPTVSENCKFEPALEGKQIGDQVANFSVKDAYGKTYTMHQSCGTSAKAIWVILAAGW